MTAIESIIDATQALSRLSSISIQDLLPHRCALEHTLRIIENTLKSIHSQSPQPRDSIESSSRQSRSISSPISPLASCAGDSSLSITRTSTSDANERNDLTGDETIDIAPCLKNLSHALSDSKQFQKIRDYLSSTDTDPISYWGDDWTQEDPRVVDIRFCSRNRSLDGKFRRGLGQRSLAIEYDNWEQRTFQTSRVLTLFQDPSAADNLNGHINQFLNLNTERFKDRNSTLHGIKHGIRLLVFELIYGHTGVSAILILLYSHFRDVKYKNHVPLKSLLRDFPSWDSVARHKSSWLEECQCRYDARNKAWRASQNSWWSTCNGQKRQRTSAQCQLTVTPRLSTDTPPSYEQMLPVTHLGTAAETQSSQESAPALSISRAIEGGTQFLGSRVVADSLGETTMSLDDQQISVQEHGAAPNTGLDNADLPLIVQSNAFSGSNTAYPGLAYPFNPLDYPNLLSDTDSAQSSQRIPSSPQFVFNPLDYPNLLLNNPPLPGPQIIASSPGFVFNPLDYPSIPPDSQGGNFDSVTSSTSLSAF